MTIMFFEQLPFYLAVFGTSGLDQDGDLLDYDLAEVRVSRAILRQSRRAFVVTDHSKVGRSAPARIASLSEIDTLFTDRPLPARLEQRCADWGTRLQICPDPAASEP